MKFAYCLLLAFSGWTTLHAQSAALSDFSGKYSKDHDPSLIKNDGWLDDLSECLAPENNNANRQNDMAPLIVAKEKVADADWEQLKTSVLEEGFETLIQVRDQGEEAVQLLIRGNDTKVSDVLFLIEEDRSKIVFLRSGNWDLATIIRDCDF